MNKVCIKQLIEQFPLICSLTNFKEVCWFNPSITSVDIALPYVGLTAKDIALASARLKRFAPLLMKAFPQTIDRGGLIESALVEINQMKQLLSSQYHQQIEGQLLLKKDSHLPISGSIKARGGIYVVLEHAEKLALQHGLLLIEDDYSILLSERFKSFFSRFSIAVGSTGNLGLSIGIISAVFGFNVTVHMSNDAKQWKKELLRRHGVTVIEYAQDYGVAVERGRKAAQQDPNCYFIDDENSTSLFLGYAVAGERVKAQLDRMSITVDEQHPLFVYLPCGVGGGPGGVVFGLKMQFGNHVHCIFAEPTHSPCMLLGVYTGLHDKISVQEIGIDNQTIADGLAVGRASGFIGQAMERLIDGYYTLSDNRMSHHLAQMASVENIKLEPSALAGIIGPSLVIGDLAYRHRMSFDNEKMKNATHIVWATGGGMVPEEVFFQYMENLNGLNLPELNF